MASPAILMVAYTLLRKIFLKVIFKKFFNIQYNFAVKAVNDLILFPSPKEKDGAATL